ncbi:MAG: class 1 fructose-bisphosphatase [Candidatus Kapaibacteriales bacterium]
MFKTSRLVTLDAHISEQELLHPDSTGKFTSLMHDLTLAIRMISREVRRAGLNDILGLTEDTNIHGEQVKKLDVYANETIKRTMDHGGHLAVIASEEEDEIFHIPERFQKGKYVLVFDPLDGSSNIDVNVTVGTIWGLYRRLDEHSEENCTDNDVIQKGSKLVAAGYALYGSSTQFVYSTGNGVNMFTYDPTIGEFVLTNENVEIPERGYYYSINEGNSHDLGKELKQYLEYLKTPNKYKEKVHSLRYIATGVADIHRTLLNGGIFMYPMYNSKPNGKLRVVYECNPLSYIVEQAGGKATNGKERILDIKPETVHERQPLFLGSPTDVDEAMSFLKGTHPYQK